MIRGSCLCAEVTFEIDETKIIMMNNCHCTNCRKVTGADYGTFIQVSPQDFKWLTGEKSVSTYDSSPGNHRAFCEKCGSRMPQSNDASPFTTIPAGSLDGDPKVSPNVNIFTGSKAPWNEINDSLPSAIDMGTPEFWAKLFPQPEK